MKKVAANAICAKFLNHVIWVGVVFEFFGHFLPIFGQNNTVYYDVFCCRQIEKSDRQHIQCVKPTTCLIKTLPDKVCRKAIVKSCLILKRIVQLRIGHRTGFEPAIKNIFDAVILFTIFMDNQLIDKVAVDVVAFKTGMLRELFQA